MYAPAAGAYHGRWGGGESWQFLGGVLGAPDLEAVFSAGPASRKVLGYGYGKAEYSSGNWKLGLEGAIQLQGTLEQLGALERISPSLTFEKDYVDFFRGKTEETRPPFAIGARVGYKW
jgi:hypothetical protein